MRWFVLIGVLAVFLPLSGLVQDSLAQGALDPDSLEAAPALVQPETLLGQPQVPLEETLSEEVPDVPFEGASTLPLVDAAPGDTRPVDTEPVSQDEFTDVSSLPRDLSPRGMFLAADWVVKSVIVSLGLASFATWTVWIAKSLQLAGARFRIKRALRLIGSAKTLEEAGRSLGRELGDGGKVGPGRGPAAIMVYAASHEAELSRDMIIDAGGEGLKERVSSSLSRIEAATARRMSKGVSLLATIGSTAPFVGLFGTVWGIMNAFIGISEAQTTNLAVVAPGIAEALLATAAGLVAAIPAVVIYNMFARSIAGYRHLLGDAAAGIERLISRDVDYRYAFDTNRGSENTRVVE